MLDIKIPTAEFITTAVAPAGYPKSREPELCFVGRSNVGKSSLINALCQRRKLVRVSNTPGRTRALNFFAVAANDGKRLHHVVLCDLPGYGFAKVSKAERAQWKELIDTYVSEREVLCAVVQLIDAEVGPTELDAQMLAWLLPSARPLVLVATKLDRLVKAKRLPALRAHERALQLPEHSLLGVSSETGLGLPELWMKLLDLSKPKKPGA
jgi:GTP-binding protein